MDEPVMEKALLTRKEVSALVGLSNTMIYKLIGQDLFPRPLKISPGAVRWKKDEVMAYIESLPRTNALESVEAE